MKHLTGLDQLGDIADGAGKFGNKAQRFYKYAKDQGIDVIEGKFATDIGKAEVHAKALAIDISGVRTLGHRDLYKAITDAATSAAAKASDHIATLKTEIAEGFDTSIATVRKQVKQAVESARAVARLGVNGIVQFEAWAALKSASTDENFKSLPDAIKIAKGKLDEAVRWHKRQTEDSRLRLKALAAHYFVEPEKDSLAICPLCEGQLTTEQQKKLSPSLRNCGNTPPPPNERLKMHAVRSSVNCARC